jgi:hypothetical protein
MKRLSNEIVGGFRVVAASHEARTNDVARNVSKRGLPAAATGMAAMLNGQRRSAVVALKIFHGVTFLVIRS